MAEAAAKSGNTFGAKTNGDIDGGCTGNGVSGQEHGVKTMLGYNYMKSPSLLAIKDLIASGRSVKSPTLTASI